jgi:hypothetical protein
MATTSAALVKESPTGATEQQESWCLHQQRSDEQQQQRIFDRILEHIIAEEVFDLHYALRMGRMSREDLFGVTKLPQHVSAPSSKQGV